MAKSIERLAGQLVLREARNLGPNEHTRWLYIGNSASWLTKNRNETIVREETFTAVIGRLNAIQDDPSTYRDVRKLKSLVDNAQLPTLGEIVSNWNERSQASLEEAETSFPEWANNRFSSNATSVWGMVIEGYGLYLGNSFAQDDPTKRDEIKRTFVLAFEAVAFMEYRDSALVNDVMGWMIEEKDSFPQEIAAQL